MRLDNAERDAIIAACRAVLAGIGAPWELRLYGSRVDDHKRGGDIDLAVVLDSSQPLANGFELKLDFLTQVKKTLGDRRIDFSIVTRDKVDEPFWQVAFQQVVVLERSAGKVRG